MVKISGVVIYPFFKKRGPTTQAPLHISDFYGAILPYQTCGRNLKKVGRRTSKLTDKRGVQCVPKIKKHAWLKFQGGLLTHFLG